MVVGASNHLPEDDALGSLVRSVPHARSLRQCGTRATVRCARRRVAARPEPAAAARSRCTWTTCDNSKVLSCRSTWDWCAPTYVELVHRLRHAGIPVSDRRAVKLQRLMAASAIAQRANAGEHDGLVDPAVHLGHGRTAGSADGDCAGLRRQERTGAARRRHTRAVGATSDLIRRNWPATWRGSESDWGNRNCPPPNAPI